MFEEEDCSFANYFEVEGKCPVKFDIRLEDMNR